MHGFLLIDKPKGITSMDVIRRLRKLSGVKRIGHAGTLDPLATGLLLVAFGQATKLIEYLMGSSKVYEVEAIFGATSNTYDADGELVESDLIDGFVLNEAVVKSAIEANFLGEIEQVPPAFSAKRVDGKRAYDIARRGEDIILKPCVVRVDFFDLMDFKKFDFSREDIASSASFSGFASARFGIKVSSGTYIRSLVHDLGQVLGCGAYVKELRRTCLANMKVEDASLLDDFEELGISEKDLINPVKILESIFPIFELNTDQYAQLKNGNVLEVEDIKGFTQGLSLAVFDGRCVGVLAFVDTAKIKFVKQIVDECVAE